MIIDSGIHVGAGSDSAQISTLNPWNMIYYMVTGKNVAGLLVNSGQQITREEAIRLYTVNNGRFGFGTNLHVESVEHDLLHGHGQKRCRETGQRRSADYP